jgi:hypothetical protein
LEHVVPEAEHPDSGDAPGRRVQLGVCQAEIVAARAQLEDARQRGARTEVERLRADLLVALEAYAAAIEHSGAPVPGRLDAELKLYRGLRNRW